MTSACPVRTAIPTIKTKQDKNNPINEPVTVSISYQKGVLAERTKLHCWKRSNNSIFCKSSGFSVTNLISDHDPIIFENKIVASEYPRIPSKIIVIINSIKEKSAKNPKSIPPFRDSEPFETLFLSCKIAIVPTNPIKTIANKIPSILLTVIISIQS